MKKAAPETINTEIEPVKYGDKPVLNTKKNIIMNAKKA